MSSCKGDPLLEPTRLLTVLKRSTSSQSACSTKEVATAIFHAHKTFHNQYHALIYAQTETAANLQTFPSFKKKLKDSFEPYHLESVPPVKASTARLSEHISQTQ